MNYKLNSWNFTAMEHEYNTSNNIAHFIVGFVNNQLLLFCQYSVTSGHESATAAARTGPATGRQRPRPKHPEYAQLQQRTTSFRGKRVPVGQNVDVLALPGFFHVGKCEECITRYSHS